MSSLLAAPRSTPRDSYRWMRWDLPCRIVPMLLAPLLLIALTPISSRSMGLTLEDLPVQLGLGALLGPLMGWLSWWYRRRIVGRVVVPTRDDAWLQSVYYVLLNTPAEELFFRGLMIGSLQSVMGPWAAWTFSTLVFGLYHIPARWGWRAVAGTTVAGGVFGLLFLLGPGPGSLVLPSIVHSFSTCAFLSAGPTIAHAVEERRSRLNAAHGQAG